MKLHFISILSRIAAAGCLLMIISACKIESSVSIKASQIQNILTQKDILHVPMSVRVSEIKGLKCGSLTLILNHAMKKYPDILPDQIGECEQNEDVVGEVILSIKTKIPTIFVANTGSFDTAAALLLDTTYFDSLNTNYNQAGRATLVLNKALLKIEKDLMSAFNEQLSPVSELNTEITIINDSGEDFFIWAGGGQFVDDLPFMRLQPFLLNHGTSMRVRLSDAHAQGLKQYGSSPIFLAGNFMPPGWDRLRGFMGEVTPFEGSTIPTRWFD